MFPDQRNIRMTLPQPILSVFLPFAILFSTSKSFSKALLLLSGAILCKGGRTVCGILRVVGMKGEERFEKYHRMLNRVKWSPLEGSKILLSQLVAFCTGPVVIAIDEHIERRGGAKIKAKGWYRDAVRSSKKQVVKCSALKWITVMLIHRFAWLGRTVALPFLTVLAPSEKSTSQTKKRHKTTIDWAMQIAVLIRRWLPSLPIILVGDGGFACIALCWRCFKLNISLVSRLRMDACLHACVISGPGKLPKKGRKLMKIKEMLRSVHLDWQTLEVAWYGGGTKAVQYYTFTCLWGGRGYPPILIKVVLLRDPEGKYESIALMSIDLALSVQAIIEAFVSRWNQEVTHREVREHLGVETQRQWSDLAIGRTTPILFGLYSIVILIGNLLAAAQQLVIQQTAWYQKENITFSDILIEVRKLLWKNKFLEHSQGKGDLQGVASPEVIDALMEQLAGVA